jgi:hypothetical protein
MSELPAPVVLVDVREQPDSAVAQSGRRILAALPMIYKSLLILAPESAVAAHRSLAFVHQLSWGKADVAVYLSTFRIIGH